MNKAADNMMKKHDYELMFKDSPEYFVIENCKILFESNMVRFICFDENDVFKEDVWFPMLNVFRIKRYKK